MIINIEASANISAATVFVYRGRQKVSPFIVSSNGENYFMSRSQSIVYVRCVYAYCRGNIPVVNL